MRNRTIKSTATTSILVCDRPGAGNANHIYEIYQKDEFDYILASLKFQDRPIENNVATGIMNEDLLTIVIDRLQGFQNGPFRCRENALALTKIQEALHWLEHRTKDRIDRGVEGKYEL